MHAGIVVSNGVVHGTQWTKRLVHVYLASFSQIGRPCQSVCHNHNCIWNIQHPPLEQGLRLLTTVSPPLPCNTHTHFVILLGVLLIRKRYTCGSWVWSARGCLHQTAERLHPGCITGATTPCHPGEAGLLQFELFAPLGSLQ